MTRPYTLVLALSLAVASGAQNLNNVLFNPNPVHECEYVNLTLVGNYPSNNYDPQFYTFDRSPSRLISMPPAPAPRLKRLSAKRSRRSGHGTPGPISSPPPSI
jgi:hypothetical protein